jgi:hypothetical protein
MLTRALWTSLIALLAWLPLGRGQALSARANGGERTAAASVAFENAIDPPARVVRPVLAQHQLGADRKAPAPHGLATIVDAANPLGRGGMPSAAASRHVIARWRGFQTKRLVVPHDATAPPENR